MKFRFWGVRGSVPTPLSPRAFKAKVSSILQRATPADLESPRTKECFLANIPPDLFGLIGGNTTCFEVEAGENNVLVIDGGTGLRELGADWEAKSKKPKNYHIFFTHFHYDHIQGLPFFPGFFYPQNKVTLYSTVKDFETIIRGQMHEPYFPVPFSVFPSQVEFVELGSAPLTISGTSIRWKQVSHPGKCTSYRFERDGKSLIFSTDTELKIDDFNQSDSNRQFYSGADALVIDAQYTLAESLDRADWGHSSSSLTVDFALEFGVKSLYLFHHEPEHNDAKIEEIGRLAQWYADHRQAATLQVNIAREGMEGSVE